MIGATGILDPRISTVVYRAFEYGGFATRSDYARQNAESVAAAAVLGFITTEMPGGGFGRTWRATAFGVDSLFIAGGKPSSLYVHGGLPGASQQATIQ